MKILKNIPSMDDNAICRLFVNAQRLLLKNKENSDAKLVLQAIKVEWEKRLKLFESGNYKATTPENGVLSVVGYKVGNEGEKPAIRQQMLDYIMSDILPPVSLIDLILLILKHVILIQCYVKNLFHVFGHYLIVLWVFTSTKHALEIECVVLWLVI